MIEKKSIQIDDTQAFQSDIIEDTQLLSVNQLGYNNDNNNDSIAAQLASDLQTILAIKSNYQLSLIHTSSDCPSQTQQSRC